METFEAGIYKRYKDLITGSGLEIKLNNVPRKVSLFEIMDDYDVFCFDGYGTLYNRGDFIYPHAKEWFDELRKKNKALRLVTNAASDVTEVLATDAKKRGFDFSSSETISSGSLLLDLSKKLRQEGRNIDEVFYIGRESGNHVLESCGMQAKENPVCPVVAVSSAKETPQSYAKAVELLREPGAILLVLDSDAWAPKTDGSREPVSGALAERLRLDSCCAANGFEGAKTYYLGKPFIGIWGKVKATLPHGARVLMVGDTLGTDVLGANIAGFDSALVLGRNQPADELEQDEKWLGIRPDYYL